MQAHVEGMCYEWSPLHAVVVVGGWVPVQCNPFDVCSADAFVWLAKLDGGWPEPEYPLQASVSCSGDGSGCGNLGRCQEGGSSEHWHWRFFAGSIECIGVVFEKQAEDLRGSIWAVVWCCWWRTWCTISFRFDARRGWKDFFLWVWDVPNKFGG